jgi:phosphoenolpyruvate---glycerone phosphotransferase subunit DhaL
MAAGKQDLLAWFDELQRVYAGNRQRLTDLDSAIGDADHGINMDRGFSAVKTELAKNVPDGIEATFKAAAMTLIKTVGGASGPLYGTFFLRAGAVCSGKTELEPADVVALFQAGVDGVIERGKAVAEDKTMLDALLPALAAMRGGLEEGASIGRIVHEAARAAEAGMRATIPMQARKGRASYLGPRSIGHQDPGATSSYLLIRAAADIWRSA